MAGSCETCARPLHQLTGWRRVSCRVRLQKPSRPSGSSTRLTVVSCKFLLLICAQDPSNSLADSQVCHAAAAQRGGPIRVDGDFLCWVCQGSDHLQHQCCAGGKQLSACHCHRGHQPAEAHHPGHREEWCGGLPGGSSAHVNQLSGMRRQCSCSKHLELVTPPAKSGCCQKPLFVCKR